MNISINKLPTLKLILEVEERKVQYTNLKDYIDKLAHIHAVRGVAKSNPQLNNLEEIVTKAEDNLSGIYYDMVSIYQELEEAVESADEDE